MIHDIINNVYKKDEDSEDHIYENTKTNEPVYENIDFSSNGRSSNETVNPTMILVSDDGEWHSCDCDLYLQLGKLNLFVIAMLGTFCD